MEMKKRVDKLEARLDVNQEPETLNAMYKKLLNGEYKDSTMMSIVVAILSNGGSGVRLKGGQLPEILIDDIVERVRKKQSKHGHSMGTIAGTVTKIPAGANQIFSSKSLK